ncbi:MAG: hypothetical protein IPH86_15060 [bacterium]|nr:hypothetical protein [bacterium]
MTYQEIGLIGEKGNIHSDQRFRGLQTQLAGSGFQTINPYFFTFHRDHSGRPDLDGKYGFKSIKTFVTSALAVENGRDPATFDGTLPTFAESARVTAILEAADLSLRENSRVVEL